MTRVNKILEHPVFRDCLEKNEAWERERVFCRHDMVHFLDVARISLLLCCEDGISTDKEIVYAAALLHDIGRWRQYAEGVPHEIASAEIAAGILSDCGFTAAESAIIDDAIISHRTKNGAKPGFAGVIYRADKLSRLCFNCKAIDECDWELKNTRIVL